MRMILVLALWSCGTAVGGDHVASDAMASSGDSGSQTGPRHEWTSGTRLKVRVTTSADGMRAFRGWYDSRLHVNCAERTTTDKIARCVPEGAIASSWYLDSQCRYRIAVTLDGSHPDYAYRMDSSSYPTITSVMQVDSEYTGDMYLLNGSTCSKQSIPSGWRAFSVRPDLPPADFVQLTDEIDQ